MHRKLAAGLLVILFVLGVLVVPVQAHFTLGVYKGTYDYHETDFDGNEGAHIPGLTGYVFPGAGPLSSPAPGFFAPIAGSGVNSYPGYQSLYPSGDPPGVPQMWLQADANAYAPFGAILTSTTKAGTVFNKLFHNGNPTIWGPRDNELDALPIEHAVEGDLVFAVNYTLPQVGGVRVWPVSPYRFDLMEIYVPPEFRGVRKENIVASFTNSWGNIDPDVQPDIEAQIVPNRWTRIRVDSDASLTGLTTGRYIEFGNQTLGDVWAYIRVNKVTAPTIAGKYFFKIRLGDYWLGYPASPYGLFKSNGVPNFPVLLVKGEVDPAYVDGTIRYGGYSGPLYYGQPLQLPGRVRLVGRAIDPFTLQVTNRPVEARGYFNSTANGHFEVEGVAPGVYDVYVSAAGYPEKLIQTTITILKGQSYHLDAYLTPGIVIDGEVFSKCGTGEVNWVTWQNTPDDGVNRQDIKIEIYKVGQLPTAVGSVVAVTEKNVQDVNAYTTGTMAIAWSPVSGKDSGWGANMIGFAWPGYGGRYANGFDTDGVGPAQQWQVTSTKSNFKFKFGDKGLYGTPTLFDGHVPQLNATWIDGLPAGQYEVRTFTYGYVQTKADGVTFEHVTFNVPAVEWPGDIYVPFDLRLSNYVKKTVHFHDVPGTLAETAIPGDGKDSRILYLEVLNEGDSIWGWKTQTVSSGVSSATIYSRGIRGQAMAYWSSGGGRNYGFHSGTYTLKAYMYGYVEQVFEKVTIGLCGSEVAISDHLYRGAMFNVTFYSKDWEHPTAEKPWKYPYEYIYLQIWKDGKQLTGFGLNRKGGSEYQRPNGESYTHDGKTQPLGASGIVRSSFRAMQGDYVINKLGKSWSQQQSTFATLYYEGEESNSRSDREIANYPTSFESGLYSFVGLTYGYVMQMDPITRTAKPFQAYVSKGGVANIPIKLVQGVQIPLIIRFKHERVFEHLRYNSTVRVRIFDNKDALVGEWLTSSSVNGTSSLVYGSGDTGLIIKGLPPDRLPASIDNSGAKRINSLRALLGPGYSFKNQANHIESVNYVPRSTMMLNLTICGIPDPYSSGFGSDRAWYGVDRVFDTAPWDPGKYGAPGAPYGINGDPWYTGGYYVQVEVVPFGNEYDRSGKLLAAGKSGGTWYPSVPGLLYGESCTIDPRTGKLYAWALPQNHIGPYQQRVHIALPGAHLGGESSGILELDHLGLASGTVYGYTWCDDWRTTSWVNVLFSGAPGVLNYYTFDGRYEAYIPAGTWKMDVIPWLTGAKAPGYGSQSFTLAISEGQAAGYNVYLEETGVPIPEFPTTLVVLASALAAPLSILRRKRK